MTTYDINWLKRFWAYGLSAIAVLLILFALAWLAGKLFDPNSEQRENYQTCVDAGGSYTYHNGGDFTCVKPTGVPSPTTEPSNGNG
jgi:hypothetical protein